MSTSAKATTIINKFWVGIFKIQSQISQGVVDFLKVLLTTSALRDGLPKKSGDYKKKLQRTVTPSSLSTLCGKLPASGPSPQQPRRGRGPIWRLFRSQSVLCLLTSMVWVIVGVHDWHWEDDCPKIEEELWWARWGVSTQTDQMQEKWHDCFLLTVPPVGRRQWERTTDSDRGPGRGGGFGYFFPPNFFYRMVAKRDPFFYQSHIFITSKVVVLMLDNFSLFKKIYKQSKPGPIIILPGQKLTQSVLSCKYSWSWLRLSQNCNMDLSKLLNEFVKLLHFSCPSLWVWLKHIFPPAAVHDQFQKYLFCK